MADAPIDSPSIKLVKPKGGKRPGSGRKPGFKMPATITKEQAREALREAVLREMSRMIRAQVNASVGLDHFFLRDKKTGKFERVIDPKAIENALNDPEASEGSTYWIYTKDPSTQAFTDLMNRALDKPKEQEQQITISGDDQLVESLLAGRKFALEKRRA